MINSFRDKYWFLSNFYPCKIEYEGKIYPSVEHAFQAAKTHDNEIRELILTADTPADAKKLGRVVTLREDWEQIKIEVMLDLVTLKFSTDPQLKQMLIATGNEELIEGNWWGDTFWGICKGIGNNWLGEILMNVREYLKK